MLAKAFDPEKFIDRIFEQELFEELLRFRSTARILSIQDSGGAGKSHLLERFRYRCRTVKPRTPVSLIALDQLPAQSPLSLVKELINHLSTYNLNFETFERYESARIDADFKVFRASMYLQGAIFSEAQDVRISTFMTNVERAETLNVVGGAPQLSAAQDEAAQSVVIKSFFDDLYKNSADQPIVLMFDAYEKASAKLKRWITDYFLQTAFFQESRPHGRLVLVIAGHEVPAFHLYWTREDCEAVVRTVSKLGKWTRADVEECLRVHGFKYEPQDLDAFHRLIERNIPPSDILQIMQSALSLA